MVGRGTPVPTTNPAKAAKAPRDTPRAKPRDTPPTVLNHDIVKKRPARNRDPPAAARNVPLPKAAANPVDPKRAAIDRGAKRGKRVAKVLEKPPDMITLPDPNNERAGVFGAAYQEYLRATRANAERLAKEREARERVEAKLAAKAPKLLPTGKSLFTGAPKWLNFAYHEMGTEKPRPRFESKRDEEVVLKALQNLENAERQKVVEECRARGLNYIDNPNPYIEIPLRRGLEHVNNLVLLRDIPINETEALKEHRYEHNVMGLIDPIAKILNSTALAEKLGVSVWDLAPIDKFKSLVKARIQMLKNDMHNKPVLEQLAKMLEEEKNETAPRPRRRRLFETDMLTFNPLHDIIYRRSF